MSADEFDPRIERLFAQTPPLSDARLFEADMQARLARGGRMRGWVLSAAGVVGGLIAVREMVSLNLNLDGGSVSAAEASNATIQAQQQMQTVAVSALEQVGLSDALLGAAGGMQMFWIVAGALIALMAAAAMRLAQDA